MSTSAALTSASSAWAAQPARRRASATPASRRDSYPRPAARRRPPPARPRTGPAAASGGGAGPEKGDGPARPFRRRRGVPVLLAGPGGQQAGLGHVGSEPGLLQGPDGSLGQGPAFGAEAGPEADLDPVHEHLGAQRTELGGPALGPVEQGQRPGEVPPAGGHEPPVVQHLGAPDVLAQAGERGRGGHQVLLRGGQFAAIGLDQRPVLPGHGRLDGHAGGLEGL